VHASFRTPVNAILVTAGVSLALALTGTFQSMAAASAISRLLVYVATCASMLRLRGARFTSIVNGRFKGGWITRRYGRPVEGVHALQLEIAQSAYMDESPPWPWDAARAAPLEALLRSLVAALSAWRP